MQKIEIPLSLKTIQKPPKELFAIGNLALLEKPKVAIVGSRNATFYSKDMAFKIAKSLSNTGVVVVSGGAIGIDTQAHKGAFPNTIAILATPLNILYPKINEKLLADISKEGLLLSEYNLEAKTSKYNFVLRNRLVVGLCDALVIVQADIDSGSMRSAEFAQRLCKPIYVLPHRINESDGTHFLTKNGIAKTIYNVDSFTSVFAKNTSILGKNGDMQDEVLEFCRKNSSLALCLEKFGDKIYEYEIEGRVKITQMKVVVL